MAGLFGIRWPKPLKRKKRRYLTPDSDEFVVVDNGGAKRQKTQGSDDFGADDDDDDFGGDGSEDDFEGIDSLPDETEKIQKRLKESFSDPRGHFTFQHLIGSGSNGVAILLLDHRVHPPETPHS
ncbi:hypothetical protein PG993_015264 [Apiospora rasikravindrae]|uniref:Uncharacterized protein n=1 Tax=Apiospora rasikravindrae TaxID=990691 RepID=A0ABR1RRJ3_9PEZI